MAHKRYSVLNNGDANSNRLGLLFTKALDRSPNANFVSGYDNGRGRVERNYDLEDTAICLHAIRDEACISIIGRPRKLDNIRQKIEKATKYQLREI